MAAESRLSPLGQERDHEDTEESSIQFYLEAFLPYIVENVSWNDLLCYEYFHKVELIKFREKSKTDKNGTVQGMLLMILEETEWPDRFTKLIQIFEDTENEKVLKILRGQAIPRNKSEYRRLISKRKHICDMLELEQILPSLTQHGVINNNESEVLRTYSKNEGRWIATLELLLILPKRSIHWYEKFLVSLIECNQEDLAEILDKHNSDIIMSAIGKHGGSLTGNVLCEDLTSLMNLDAPYHCPGRHTGYFDDRERNLYMSGSSNETELKQVYANDETAVKQYVTTGDGTMEASVVSYTSEATAPENNLSSCTLEDFSVSMETSFDNSVKRPLEQNFDQSMSLSFSTLLLDSENTEIQGDQQRRSLNPGLRSLTVSDCAAGGATSDSAAGRSEMTSFDKFLLDMEQPKTGNTGMTNKLNREISKTDNQSKPTFPSVQKLTTSKSHPSKEAAAAMNLHASHQNDLKIDNLYDRAKMYRENSQSPVQKELRDKDLDMGDQRLYNISGTADVEDGTEEVADSDITLREYQQELAAPATQGNNVIIVAPTGSGKTRVAMRIIQEHIRQQQGRSIAKVIFLVNQVALANQQGEECRRLLKKYTCKVITGESERKSECLKDFIDKRDILVVTAQVLLDALVKREITSVNRFSLIVFDECHHTHANHTFNQIMGRYMDLKFDKTDSVLPQIVGLTASVGVGKARNEEKAVEHIKHLMANLDAQVICTVQNNMEELRQHVSLPEEETHTVAKRSNDQFGAAVTKLMNTIEKRMNQSSLVKEIPEAAIMENSLKAPAQKGTAQYTQWVNKLWRETAKLKSSEARRFVNPCRAHLEHYNNALIIYNDARMEDALHYLDTEMKDKSIMDQNELILHGAFRKLRDYRFRTCANPKLEKLCEMIMKAYQNNFEDSRGIVFVKTRDLSKAILSWMKDTPGLRELNPIQFVGTNTSADRGGMTKAEQDDALEYFRNGKHKLIVATSVAEEGLDISKCNLVIRYDHVTNEIAMVQSRGRGRAADSKYYVIAEETTGMAEKEELNMIREVMMRKAIIQLQEYIANSPERFRKEIYQFQDEANVCRQLKALGSRRRLIRTGQFELRCIKCDHFICWSDDVKKIQNSHHVVADEHFVDRVSLVKSGSSRYQDEAIQFTGKLICKECGGNLGVVCIHKSVEFPVLKIENFLIVDTNGRQDTCKRWKDAPFDVAGLSNEDWKDILKSKKEKGDFV